MDLGRERKSYERATLDPEHVDPDPLVALQAWRGEALEAGEPEGTAMTVATVAADGTPSARVVLCKGVEDGGLLFFTHGASRKGRELAADPRAAAVLFWPGLERQVRVVGAAHPVSAQRTRRYFASRPAGSQRGALASRQSEPITDRAALEAQLQAVCEAHPDDADVPVPEGWTGYVLVPDEVELWQGREDRLHDRLHWRRGAEGAWRQQRLQP